MSMKNLSFVLFIALAAFSNSSIAAPLDEKLEEFRQFLLEFRRDKNIPSFSVAVVKDGEIVLAEGIGWQDHDAEEQTTIDTTYLVASISKTFTAATLLAMEADGHINLDDDSRFGRHRRCLTVDQPPTRTAGGYRNGKATSLCGMAAGGPTLTQDCC